MNEIPLDNDFYDFIKGWEEFSGEAYLDEIGRPTIGYGTTFYEYRVESVEMGDIITLEEAERELKHNCNGLYDFLLKALKVEQSKRQLIALLSLCYDIGFPNFIDSKLLKLINSAVANKDDIANQFRRWARVWRNVSNRRVLRREAEITCYFMVDTPT